MPDLIQSKYAKGLMIQPYPRGAGEIVTVRAAVTLLAAQVAINNVIEMMAMPDNCRLVDMTLIATDLDTNVSPTITLDAGLVSGTFGDDDNTRTCGAEFFDGDTSAQAGGVARMSLATGFNVEPSATTRGIGVKIAAAAATAAGGTITLIAQFAVAD